VTNPYEAPSARSDAPQQPINRRWQLQAGLPVMVRDARNLRAAWAFVAGLVAFAGCSADSSRSVVSAPVQAPQNHPSPSTSSGLGPPDASLSPPSGGASEQANACLMLYECGCNAGCVQIDHPSDALRAGMRVGVLSGSLEGTTVFVAKSTTAEGEPVFTVQRRDPNASIELCSRPGPAIGYICAGDALGPARACRSCNAGAR
jgi:hypothetical protein